MKRKLSIIIILVILLLPTTIFASSGSLSSVESMATINSDGTVKIEQLWKYDDSNVSQGTEHYINLRAKYSNDYYVGDEETITDYKVYLDGEPLEFVENWNVNGTFEDKVGKYGIMEKGNSVELCFGISKYEQNDFKIEYLVHNAIKETTEGEKYLHWTFTPTNLDPNPSSLSAIIETGDAFFIDKVYGFNYEGNVVFDNLDKKDKVIATMNEGTYSANTALNIFAILKDEEDLIKNTKPTGQSLDNKVTQVFEGSDYNISEFYEDVDNKERDSIMKNSEETIPQELTIVMIIGFSLVTLLFAIFTLAGPIIFIVFIIYIIRGMQDLFSIVRNVDAEQKKLWRETKDYYRRDEPDEVEDIYPLFQLTIGIPRIRQNVLLYFISKWTSEGVFEYRSSSEIESGFFRRKSSITTFKIHEYKLDKDASLLEKDLFSKFYELVDIHGTLDTKTLEKLKIRELEAIFKQHEEVYKERLIKKGYAVIIDKNPELTEAGIEAVNQHAGLRNFLRDFTLIHEREAGEIKLWDYYFHMAALYGLAEVFKKQLDSIPNLDINNRQTYNRYYGAAGASSLNRSISKTVSSSYSSYTSRSSGGGGGSSSGGGGGSSGGGSGGGTR